ncbi:hypothetical protein Tco_1544795 [Tanacetum coccineum]
MSGGGVGVVIGGGVGVVIGGGVGVGIGGGVGVVIGGGVGVVIGGVGVGCDGGVGVGICGGGGTSDDSWTHQRVTRGTGVCQYEVLLHQACSMMRRLVECKMTKIPLDPAISLVECLKRRKCPHPLGAINTRHAAVEWGV